MLFPDFLLDALSLSFASSPPSRYREGVGHDSETSERAIAGVTSAQTRGPAPRFAPPPGAASALRRASRGPRSRASASLRQARDPLGSVRRVSSQNRGPHPY